MYLTILTFRLYSPLKKSVPILAPAVNAEVGKRIVLRIHPVIGYNVHIGVAHHVLH